MSFSQCFRFRSISFRRSVNIKHCLNSGITEHALFDNNTKTCVTLYFIDEVLALTQHVRVGRDDKNTNIRPIFCLSGGGGEIVLKIIEGHRKTHIYAQN